MQKKTIIRKLTGILCLIISALLTVMFCSHYVPIFIDYKKSADLYDNIRKSNTKDYEKEPDLKAIIPNTVSEIDKYAPIEVDSESLLENIKMLQTCIPVFCKIPWSIMQVKNSND
nr:hypothetical protein [uncultured Blautia sp.]